MFHLIIAILCSSSIALVFKYSETRNLNRYAVTCTNYAVASIISVGFLLESPNMTDDIRRGLLLLPRIIRRASMFRMQLSESELTGWAILIGCIAGIFFYLAFIFYQKSVRHHGVGLAGAFAKLGIFVPMTLSLLLWREIPGITQWVGMGMAVCAILMSHWPGGNHASTHRSWSLVLLFLLGGAAEFSNKIFQYYGSLSERPVFLFFTFFLALILSSLAVFRTGKIHIRDIGTGVLVGIPNLFSSFFLIRALVDIPASVAFPVFGAGTIAIISAVGSIAFGEKLSVKNITVIGLVAVSIILVSL